MSSTASADRVAEGSPSVEAETHGAAAWPAVVSLALGVFGLVTAEFLPASLLTPMARDLAISDGLAGQAVTATAVVAAFAGPAIVIGTAKVDRRGVIWILTLALILSNMLAAVATNIGTLLVARVALGVALGGFWSLAAALAIRLVGMEHLPRAMAIIFTGVSAATVCAAPVGAFIGDIWGWRAAFMVAAAIAVLALVAQLLTVPRLPSQGAASLGSLWRVLNRPKVRLGIATALLVVSGHFAGFTYVRSYLEQVTRLDGGMVSLALLAFGVSGFLGNLAGGWAAARSARVAVAGTALLLAAAAVGLLAAGASTGFALVAVAAWGFVFGGQPIGVQTWNSQAAPDDAESAGALIVTTYQVGITSGAIIGGLLVDGLGAPGPILFCALAAVVGGLLMLTVGARLTGR